MRTNSGRVTENTTLASNMKLILTLIVSLLGGASLLAADKPNIIFILADDVGQGDIGCYGQKLIKTPNLDRMAAEGTRYTQAYCGTSICEISLPLWI